MLSPQWIFLVVVTVSFLWESEGCSLEDGPRMPPSYGNYMDKTYNWVAGQISACFCCKIKVTEYGHDSLVPISPTGSQWRKHHLNCIRNDFMNQIVNDDDYCCYEYLYERGSWMLMVGFHPERRTVDLGSLKKPMSQNETADILYNWLKELNVTFPPPLIIYDCPSGPTVSVLWFLPLLIPFLIYFPLKFYIDRQSNRVYPVEAWVVNVSIK